MNILDKQTQIANAFSQIHSDIVSEFKCYETEKKIINDLWEKKGLGTGHSVIIDDGDFFDKAGINFSNIRGDKLPDSSKIYGVKSNPPPNHQTGSFPSFSATKNRTLACDVGTYGFSG